MKEKQKNGMGFQFEQSTGWNCGIWAGIWNEKKKQFAGKWDQDPPSGPSVEKQKQQMIKLRNLGGAEKFFLCHKMNKSASTGGFSLLMKLFIQVYENK